MKNLFRWVGAIFAGVGAVLLAASVVMLDRDGRFADAAVAAEGTVSRLVRKVSRDDSRSSSGVTYTAVIVFADGAGRQHEFAEQVSSNPPRFSPGDKVRVLYDPAHPGNAVVDDFWGRKGLAVIFMGIAVPITVIGAALLAVDAARRRRRTRLLKHGLPIEADFVHVFRDTRISHNGEHPFRVVAQARDPASGAMRRFESEPVWVDPSASLDGRRVPVLVDPEDRSRYYVDLSATVAGYGEP